MALASLEDVKRVLRISASDVDEERDSQLRASLRAVEDWIAPSLGKITAEGPQVEVYFDVYEDATLYLPAPDVTVVRVRAYNAPITFEETPLPAEMELGSGYDLDDQGRLILRPTMLVSPFEGAYATRSLRLYSKIEVYYISTGVVPPSITEGIALLAAGYWREGPALLQAITHEKIGDYEYWTSTGQESKEDTSAYITRALGFLNGNQRRARVQVT